MTAQHVFEDGIYLLNKVAVAKNPLFRSENNLLRFKEKSEQYLEPLCKILAYAYHDNQWEILVKMKSRKEFVEFYKNKHDNLNINEFLIPESSYIFSQEIANLQSGFAKHYNWLNKRVGALFYRRYQKELIGSESILVETIARLDGLKQRNPHHGEWAIKKIMRIKDVGERSSGKDLKKENVGTIVSIEDRVGMKKDDLEGYFNCLPALRIENPFPRFLRQLFKILSFFESKT